MDKKLKNAEKNLIIAMIFCLMFGFLLIGFTLRCYLKNEPDDYFIHSQKPVPKDVFYGQFTVLHSLTYTLIPLARVISWGRIHNFGLSA
jgi:hypothetical protein